MRWWHSATKPCFCTSPKGYWCTRTDRHAVHEAAGGTGRVYSRWKGDYPDEQELIDLFSSAEQFRSALSPGVGEELSAADHNDLVWGVRGIGSWAEGTPMEGSRCGPRSCIPTVGAHLGSRERNMRT